MRYIRAFLKAVQMTVRGETYVRPHEPLWAWIEQGEQYAAAALQALDDNLENGRTKLQIEGREITVNSIVGGVAHHFRQEYPYLLRHFTQYSITGIYAMNMNDQFYVIRLLESDALKDHSGRDSLARLSQHLNSIPPSDTLT